MKKFYTLSFILLASFFANAQIVINEVYGGGGNSGSTYKNDFIELINNGTSDATLSGGSLQYASSAGTFNQYHTLPDITLAPGQKYLIQEAAGAGGTTNLPTPDYIAPIPTNFGTGTNSTPGFAMAASNGKIALVNNLTQITTPTDSNVLDFVGYGTANSFEGSAAAPAISATLSASRTNGIDSNNNTADFTTGSPSPENKASLSVKQNSISGLNVYPNPVTDGNLYITSDSSEAKTVAVYDILGKQVLNAKTSNNAVNVSSLKGGSYIVKITEEGKTDTRKLIIQ